MNTIPKPQPRQLPSVTEMRAAIDTRDANYDGLFFFGVRTTGIFCRPTCPARKPLPQHVTFFATAADALSAGYRACKRCRPLISPGTLPDWLEPLLEQVEAHPTRPWKDRDIRALGFEPTRVSRWFKTHHGMTFHTYLRCRRLSRALAQLSLGDRVTDVALDAGYHSLSGFREAFQKWIGATPTGACGRQVVLVNRMPTPLGPMVVAADSEALHLLEFADRRMLHTQFARMSRRLGCTFCPGQSAVMDRAQQELADYFAGEREAFHRPHPAERHRISTAGLGGTASDSFRSDDQL